MEILNMFNEGKTVKDLEAHMTQDALKALVGYVQYFHGVSPIQEVARITEIIILQLVDNSSSNYLMITLLLMCALCSTTWSSLLSIILYESYLFVNVMNTYCTVLKLGFNMSMILLLLYPTPTRYAP